MKLRKILLCLLVLTTLCGCQKAPAGATSDTTAAPTQPTPAADAVEYRLPKDSQWFIGMDSYEEMSAHLDAQESPLPNLDPKFGTARLDGSYLLLQANESQKQAVIDAAVRLLPQCCEVYNSVSPSNYVAWSDDFSTLTYGFDYTVLLDTDPTVGMLRDLSTSEVIDLMVRCNRILLTGDCDVPIVITYENPETGYILDSTLYPYEGVFISGEDWKKSATEDVLVHDGKENYIYMKMEFRETRPDRIVFAPLEKDSYYPDDALLAKRRFNDDGEEIYDSWDFEPGDIFYLRVDGTYADDKDGGDIPLIESAGMIPERYFGLKG